MKSTTIFEEVIVAEDMDESMNPFFYTCIYNINLLFSILSNTHIIYFAIENEFHPVDTLYRTTYLLYIQTVIISSLRT